MTIQECYEAIGGNYDDVLKRVRSEALIQRFTLKFLADKSYPQLKESLEAKNYEDAFRGAHTLKGVCSNLGFSKLCDLSSQLTEILRGRELEGYEAVLAQVEKQYQITVEAIRELGQ